jgi:hypothetical protein
MDQSSNSASRQSIDGPRHRAAALQQWVRAKDDRPAVKVGDQDSWIVHILSREAEALISPTSLTGTAEPHDND